MRPTPASGQRVARVHRAARIEDWFHGIRERSARRRGHVPTIVPYAGYGSVEWVRILCRVLLSKPTDARGSARTRARREQGIRGWRSFTSVPVGDVAVRIRIGGQEMEVVADRGGVVDATVPVSLEPGRHEAVLSTDGGVDQRAPIDVIAPGTRFGIISDVDDTVMVTALPRPMLAAWNTFVLDEHARMPTPGMAVLLERLSRAHPDAPVIYLSTGAWNVAPTLTRFLSRNLYPAGPLLLTDWGPTHDRLFRSGRIHKEDNLRRLAEEFPDIRWVLIGDDGQHDEEIYGEFAAEHPERVAAIAIRQLSAGEAVLAGGRSRAELHGVSAPWISANDGAEIVARMEQLDLL